MPFPFQFHKRRSEIAPFLHFSTLCANRKSEIGNHWVISDFWFPITPLPVHPRAEKMEQSARPPGRATCTHVHVYIVCCFHGLLILKAGYLFICLFIYLLIHLFIHLFDSLFVYFVIGFYVFVPAALPVHEHVRAFYMYVYIACCFLGY